MNQVAIIAIAVGSILLTFAFTYGLLALSESKKAKGKNATKAPAEWMAGPKAAPKKPKRWTLEGFSSVGTIEQDEESESSIAERGASAVSTGRDVTHEQTAPEEESTWIDKESWESKKKPTIQEEASTTAHASEEMLISTGARAQAKKERLKVSVMEASFSEGEKLAEEKERAEEAARIAHELSLEAERKRIEAEFMLEQEKERQKEIDRQRAEAEQVRIEREKLTEAERIRLERIEAERAELARYEAEQAESIIRDIERKKTAESRAEQFRKEKETKTETLRDTIMDCRKKSDYISILRAIDTYEIEYGPVWTGELDLVESKILALAGRERYEDLIEYASGFSGTWGEGSKSVRLFEMRMTLALAYEKTGKLDEALETYENTVATTEAQANTIERNEYALLIASGRIRELIGELGRLIMSEPSLWNAWNELLDRYRINLEIGKNEICREMLDQLVELDPERETTQVLRSVFLFYTGRKDPAKTTLKHYATAHPDKELSSAIYDRLKSVK